MMHTRNCLAIAPHASPYFFYNDTATTDIYTLSLHDALPIYRLPQLHGLDLRDEPVKHVDRAGQHVGRLPAGEDDQLPRSEEHTSELQSLAYLVCRLLLEKKKRMHNRNIKSYNSEHNSTHCIP